MLGLGGEVKCQKVRPGGGHGVHDMPRGGFYGGPCGLRRPRKRLQPPPVTVTAGGTAPRVRPCALVPARDPPRGGTAGQRRRPPLCSAPPCSRARPAARASLAKLTVLRAACFAACSVRALSSRALGACCLVLGAQFTVLSSRSVQGAWCVLGSHVLPLATLAVLRASCFAACSVRALSSRALGACCLVLGAQRRTPRRSMTNTWWTNEVVVPVRALGVRRLVLGAGKNPTLLDA